jgi:hypothetical protein
MSGSRGIGQGELPEVRIQDMKDALGNLIAPTDFKGKDGLGTADLERLVIDISDEEVNRIISVVEKVTADKITALEFTIFDYVGFDPRMVSRVFKVFQNYYQSSDEDLLSDIRFSVAACLYMGNLQLVSMTRRGLEGRAKLEYLAKKYNIRLGSTGTGIPATALTFPRIAAAYPVIAVRMATKVSPKAVNLDFKSGLVPNYMRLTPFGSLCSAHMGSELRLFLLQACNAHGADMAIAFETGRQKKDHKEIKYNPASIASDQWTFMEVASTSPVPSEESRKKLLAELNLYNDYSALAEVVKNYLSITTKKAEAEVVVLSEKEFTDALGAYLTS